MRATVSCVTVRACFLTLLLRSSCKRAAMCANQTRCTRYRLDFCVFYLLVLPLFFQCIAVSSSDSVFTCRCLPPSADRAAQVHMHAQVSACLCVGVDAALSSIRLFSTIRLSTQRSFLWTSTFHLREKKSDFEDELFSWPFCFVLACWPPVSRLLLSTPKLRA